MFKKREKIKIFMLLFIFLLPNLTRADEYLHVPKKWNYASLVGGGIISRQSYYYEESSYYEVLGYAAGFPPPVNCFGIGSKLIEIRSGSLVGFFPVYFYWVPYIKWEDTSKIRWRDTLGIRGAEEVAYFLIGFNWLTSIIYKNLFFRCGLGFQYERLGLEMGISISGKKQGFFIGATLSTWGGKINRKPVMKE